MRQSFQKSKISVRLMKQYKYQISYILNTTINLVENDNIRSFTFLLLMILNIKIVIYCKIKETALTNHLTQPKQKYKNCERMISTLYQNRLLDKFVTLIIFNSTKSTFIYIFVNTYKMADTK